MKRYVFLKIIIVCTFYHVCVVASRLLIFYENLIQFILLHQNTNSIGGIDTSYTIII